MTYICPSRQPESPACMRECLLVCLNYWRFPIYIYILSYAHVFLWHPINNNNSYLHRRTHIANSLSFSHSLFRSLWHTYAPLLFVPTTIARFRRRCRHWVASFGCPSMCRAALLWHRVCVRLYGIAPKSQPCQMKGCVFGVFHMVICLNFFTAIFHSMLPPPSSSSPMPTRGLTGYIIWQISAQIPSHHTRRDFPACVCVCVCLV